MCGSAVLGNPNRHTVRAFQEAAGHWGVPLIDFQGEPFFGQDRLDVLLWRMTKAGLADLP